MGGLGWCCQLSLGGEPGIAINFLPLPWWGVNSVVRNMIYYSLGAWYGAQLMAWMKGMNLRRSWLILIASGAVSVVEAVVDHVAHHAVHSPPR